MMQVKYGAVIGYKTYGFVYAQSE